MGAILGTIITIVLTLLGMYFTEKSRLTTIMDDLFSLKHEWNLARHREKEAYPNEISNIQLKIKHLLIEVMKISLVRMSQPQLRLIADTCEDLLYYDEANKYWKKCLKKKFIIPEIESEYHRRYAQFLYEKLLYYNMGEEEYNKAIKLSNDNAGQRYINYSTYTSWINDILESEKSIHFNKELLPHNTELLDNCIKKARFVSQGILNRNQREECHKEIVEYSMKVEERKLKINGLKNQE